MQRVREREKERKKERKNNTPVDKRMAFCFPGTWTWVAEEGERVKAAEIVAAAAWILSIYRGFSVGTVVLIKNGKRPKGISHVNANFI